MIKQNKYLRYLVTSPLFGTERTKEILNVNPTIVPQRPEASVVKTTVYDYNDDVLKEHAFSNVEECLLYKDTPLTTWINIEGIRKADVELVCNYYNVHPLIVEDILSVNQRPKMDEVEDIVYCLLNMLYFNEKDKSIETEQISIVLGKNFVISFQEDAVRDVFDPVRTKLKMAHSKIRQRCGDYLLYSLLDMIVDNYFIVMEKLGEQIEMVEEEVTRNSSPQALARISHFRKEMIVLKRNISPVRDLLNNIVRSESQLLDERTNKYFKDVYDHIVQAYDLTENYRDVMVNIQDLYINNVNLRMNEVMKVMAIVTCLLAPATVIGGIFGMNFETIPLLHNHWGFSISVGLMLLIPIIMLRVFRKRGWF